MLRILSLSLFAWLSSVSVYAAQFVPSYSYITTENTPENTRFILCNVEEQNEDCSLFSSYKNPKEFYKNVEVTKYVIKKMQRSRKIRHFVTTAAYFIPWSSIRVVLGPLVSDVNSSQNNNASNSLTEKEQLESLQSFVKLSRLLLNYGFNSDLEQHTTSIDSSKLASGITGMLLSAELMKLFENAEQDALEALGLSKSLKKQAVLTSKSMCLDEHFKEIDIDCSDKEVLVQAFSKVAYRLNFGRANNLKSIQIKFSRMSAVKTIKNEHFLNFIFNTTSKRVISDLNGITDRDKIKQLISIYVQFN